MTNGTYECNRDSGGECQTRDESDRAFGSTHLGVGTLGAGDLDGTETAVVTTLAHELHWLAVAEAAEPVGHDAGLWAKGNKLSDGCELRSKGCVCYSTRQGCTGWMIRI